MVNGHWAIWRNGIMLNEGGTPVNFTILWPWSSCGFFVYLYWYGRQMYWPRSHY